MFGIGDIFKSLINPATLLQLATGPAGWASLAMQTLMSTVGKEILQQLGQQLGLPQSIIDVAQTALATASGNPGAANIGQAISGLSNTFGLQGAAAGQFEREAKNQVQDFVQQQVQQTLKSTNDELGESLGIKAKKGGAGAKGGSVLMRIALALGSAMDKKVDRMAAISDKLGALGEATGKNQSQYQTLSAELTAVGQEMKIMGEALSNTLKSIGEASSNLARKQ
jgi:hypothetical protein